MRIGVSGVGAVGARVAAHLAVNGATLVELSDPRADVARSVAAGIGATARAVPRIDTERMDAVVLAGPAGAHVAAAHRAVMDRCPVVSVSDSLGDVRRLLGLDADARERQTSVIVGAGMAPGLTDLLAGHGARSLDAVHEIHVAKFGTGGPACARQHHRALGATGLDRRDGRWIPRAGGSGRELCWFPEPVGGADCYRAELPDPLLLAPVFPAADRITARMAATRRDRLTSRLPMLRPPHPEGALGAVRVEVRGESAGERVVLVYGASAPPAVGAAAVAAFAAIEAVRRPLTPGATGLAAAVDASPALARVAELGVHSELFEGKF